MKKFWVIIFFYCCISSSYSAERTINLVINYKKVNFAGKHINAISVNNQIPAPTLHFKEGDLVTINVTNHLTEETAIHWHGVLLPWQMDGVLGISQSGIPPGHTFKYRFKLMQSGTYWYHAHAGMQEQQGLYGALLIDPKTVPSYQHNKDYVVVLSDWINSNPENVLANLKKDGDYYSPKFPLQPSLVKFIDDYHKANTNERKRLIDDYTMMQHMRMSLYDINDVAYDAFLLNGKTKHNPWTAPVHLGDVVRLRFIGASSETIFHVKISNATMQIIQVDGNDVRPYQINDFTIAPGETYDVLVKISRDAPYIIYAESLDTVGEALGALITRPQQTVDNSTVAPFPEPPPVSREMMDNLMHGMNQETHLPMQHLQMDMPTEPSTIGDIPTLSTTLENNDLTVGTKYQHLTARVKTNHPGKPISTVIRMELFGYMNHFIWMINGLPEYQAKPIRLNPGERYRLIFTNNSMMRHPMHIHGHWFILRNGHGAWDPLLHTIEVAPGSTVVTDIDTDASGQWFFHCHMMYHMTSGMARVFQYTTLLEITRDEANPQDIIEKSKFHNRPIVRVDEVSPIDLSLVHHPMGHHTGIWFATLLDIGADPFHNVQRLTYKGLYGSDYNKLELFTNDAEKNKGTVDNADIDIFYWRLVSQFWSVKGGINYFYRPASKPYWQPGIGIEGLMPYFIDTDLRAYYYSGSAKIDLEVTRDTQITNNFFIQLGVRSIFASKTATQASIGSGLNQMRYIVKPYYRLMPGLNLFAEYEHEKDYGSFKNIQSNAGEQTMQNTVSFGLTTLL